MNNNIIHFVAVLKLISVETKITSALDIQAKDHPYLKLTLSPTITLLQIYITVFQVH